MKIRLEKDEDFTLRGDSRGVRILCGKGILWVTQAGDPKDHFLGPQEEFVIDRPGAVILEARREAIVAISAGS